MERSLPLSSRKARRTRARSWAKPVAGCACRNHADATLSTMAVNEPVRSHAAIGRPHWKLSSSSP
jgi:hypothetical protein